MSDGEFAAGVVTSVDTHGLSHLEFVEVGPRRLSELVELSLHLQGLKLLFGRLESLVKLLLLVLLPALQSVAVLHLLAALAQLLARTLLHLLVLLQSVAALALDEAALVLPKPLPNASRSLVEAKNLMKKI